jgi:hypothetical protein
VLHLAVDLKTRKTVYISGLQSEINDPDLAPCQLFDFNVNVDQTSYLPGKDVKVQFALTNISSKSLAVFDPFPQGVNVELLTSRPRDMVRSLAVCHDEFELSTGDALFYDIIWDQKDNNGKQISPGWYEVDVKSPEVPTLEELGIFIDDPLPPEGRGGPLPSVGQTGSPVFIFVEYLQGAMEKTIVVNEHQTATDLPLTTNTEELLIDVTVTLESIELSKNGTKFSVFATSSDSPRGKPFDNPKWTDCTAEYAVDGVKQEMYGRGWIDLDNGVRFTWGEHRPLNPVPADAKEFSLTIHTIGHNENWEGPWEFHVSLQ